MLSQNRRAGPGPTRSSTWAQPSASHCPSTPPGRYAQTVATAASLKTGSYALGAAATGLLAGALTARQLMLVVAAGQLLALVPLLPPRLGPGRCAVSPEEVSTGPFHVP